MNSCIFCKIIKGEIPSFKIWENQDFLAFLTIAPINPGHTLVIPKEHTEDIFDLDDQKLGQLLIACKPIAKTLKTAFQPKTGKIGIMVAGLEVSHPHIHLIPMEAEGDLNFAKSQPDYPKDQLSEDLKKIKDCQP